MVLLSTNFYRIQFALLILSSISSSFSMFLAWYVVKFSHSTITMSWTLAGASLVNMGILVTLSFIKIHGMERAIGIYLAFLTTILLASLLLFNNEAWIVFVSLLTCWLSVNAAFVKTISVSLVPRLVVRTKVADAFAQKTAIFSIETIIGPVFGGVLLSYIDGSSFILTLIAAAMAAVYLLMSSNDDYASYTNIDATSEINGFRIVFRVRTELCIAIISAIFNFVFTPFLLLMVPIYLLRQLNMTTIDLGLLQGTFALGLMIGSVYLVKLANILIGSRLSIVIGGIIMSIGIIIYSITDIYFILLATHFLSGIGLALFNVNATTIRSMATPEQHRTKVESAFLFICMSSIPLGMVVFGWLIDIGSVHTSMLLSGAILAITSISVIFVPFLKYLSSLDKENLNGAYLHIFKDAFTIL